MLNLPETTNETLSSTMLQMDKQFTSLKSDLTTSLVEQILNTIACVTLKICCQDPII